MKAALLLAFSLIVSSAHGQDIRPALSEPSPSPDGSEIAFVSGGDIWTVPATGGEARILISHPATESRPMYSPDGRWIAFVSNRFGSADIFVVSRDGGEPRRITFDDAPDQLDGWSRDGKWLYFTSTSRNIARSNDIWRVAASGGSPMQVSAERYVNEFFSAPRPDGTGLAFVARGMGPFQWWRNGHSHIDDSEIILMPDISKRHYETITADGAKELWPMWSPDGTTLWYMSDRSGAENLWTLIPGGGKPKQITTFTDGRVLWPSISTDGRLIVFERNLGIWKLDAASGKTAEIAVHLRGVAGAVAIEHQHLTDHFTDLAASADGKKIAFIARGELFAAAAKGEDNEAVRLSNTEARESDPRWSPDSRVVVFVSDRGGAEHLYQYDFSTEKETQLTSGDAPDDTPRFSPDGKSVGFIRGGHQLMVLELGSKQVRAVTTALFDRRPLGSENPYAWSPDGKWLAYLDFGNQLLRNVFVVPVAGGTGKPVTFLANSNSDSVNWSSDGTFILVSSGQRTENGRIARVDLVPVTPKLREDQFRDLFRDPKTDDKPSTPEKTTQSLPSSKAGTPAAKSAPRTTPVNIVFEGIRNRTRLLPIDLDAQSAIVGAGDKWIAFIATSGGDENVYAYSIDELADDAGVPKPLSSTSGHKSSLQFSSDGKSVFFLDAGKVRSATLDPVHVTPVAVTAEMDVDFAREKEQSFREVWTWLRDNFFDEKMNGVDWNAQHEKYAPRVAAAATPDEFRRLMNLMIGELNASHSGVNPPASQNRPATGRIGLIFDRSSYESAGLLKVSEVVPLSPADVAKIRVGEVVAAVDGQATGTGVNFDDLMNHKIGKRVVLTIAGADAAKREVVLQPVASRDEHALLYRAWVNSNRDYVDRISKGRIGYVHMFDMGSESLSQLFVDLDAENRSRDGVIVDVRNNNGGFVNVYAIDVLARRNYLTMTQRGFPAAAARTQLGQRSLEKPTALVTNRESLSDAEDFSEGYRRLKLGPIVGEPTAGWIIFTSNVTLMDGSDVRMPCVRIQDADGQDMEMHPRPVDDFVKRPIGESFEGKDSQLDAAVKDLLATIQK